MAFTLPLPVRVAAGIIATGIQVVRALPEEIPAIPVTLAGNAMRLSMKVQQEITTLATRGDELIGTLTGRQPVDNPSWATFDEDKEPARAPVAAATKVKPKPRPTRTPAHPSAPAPATGSGDRHGPAASSLPDPDSTAMQAAADVGDAVVDLATHARPSRVPAGSPTGTPEETVADPSPTEATGADPADPADLAATPPDAARPDSADPTTPPDAAGAEPPPAPADADADADGASNPPDEDPTDEDPTDVSEVTNGPAALPGYDGMTLAQVRGHLRELSAAQVSTLLDYEQSGDNRAPFLTLLSNRLVTLGTQES